MFSHTTSYMDGAAQIILLTIFPSNARASLLLGEPIHRG